jgi:hypothetical protein
MIWKEMRVKRRFLEPKIQSSERKAGGGPGVRTETKVAGRYIEVTSVTIRTVVFVSRRD